MELLPSAAAGFRLPVLAAASPAANFRSAVQLPSAVLLAAGTSAAESDRPVVPFLLQEFASATVGVRRGPPRHDLRRSVTCSAAVARDSSLHVISSLLIV